jgi:hypothetical protein
MGRSKIKQWIGCSLLLIIGYGTGRAQGFDAEQLILDWEKLTELKTILNDMYKGYQIVENGYGTIRDISHGSFDLHKAFLDGLLAVSPEVKSYYKVIQVIEDQSRLVKEYKSALGRFRSDRHFSAAEIGCMVAFYGELFNGSVQTLEALITVLTDGELRASDDERLKQIDALASDMQHRLRVLEQFNNSQELLSLQRARDAGDVEMVKKLYGLNN